MYLRLRTYSYIVNLFVNNTNCRSIHESIHAHLTKFYYGTVGIYLSNLNNYFTVLRGNFLTFYSLSLVHDYWTYEREKRSAQEIYREASDHLKDDIALLRWKQYYDSHFGRFPCQSRIDIVLANSIRHSFIVEERFRRDVINCTYKLCKINFLYVLHDYISSSSSRYAKWYCFCYREFFSEARKFKSLGTWKFSDDGNSNGKFQVFLPIQI